jgi:nicotinamidase/pyrazinamidase
MTTGILIVDPQLDFFPGGALGVQGGDQIVAPINALIEQNALAPVFVTRDWHPTDTKHFQARGGIWVPHCVQGTLGASFHEGLNLQKARVYSKGTDPENDAGYSAFEGVSVDDTTLLYDLVARHVDSVVVCGLATDYCVKASVLDARKHGLMTFLFLPGVRPVELKEGDGDAAIAEMKAAGALVLQ